MWKLKQVIILITLKVIEIIQGLDIGPTMATDGTENWIGKALTAYLAGVFLALDKLCIAHHLSVPEVRGGLCNPRYQDGRI